MQKSNRVVPSTLAFPPRLIVAGFLLVLTAAAASARQQSAQDLLQQADQVFQQMSQMTGLPIKAPLKKQVISRPEVEKYLIENLHKEMTPAEIHAQEVLVRAFGLVSKDFSLEKFLVSFYTEQVAGFYDPERKTMFIADWLPEDMQAMTLSHELTHALQDQSWDLESYMHAARDNDDATSARQAVVEGYATAAMLQQTMAGIDLGQVPSLTPLIQQLIPTQFAEYPAFSSAPYFFRMAALFPYVQGVGFIQAGLQTGGWKSLNELFEHPPQNTAQIFEPQTYFSQQSFPRTPFERPAALEGAGLRFLTANTMGELGYYSVLGQLISEEEAQTVGPSWRADRYLLYERNGGNDYTLVARTRWATPDAALAFFRDYRTILAHKYPQLTTDPRSSPDEFMGSASNGAIVLLHQGDECRWAEGLPAGKLDAARAWLRGL